MAAERLEEAKRDINNIEERLQAGMPEKPWKVMKELRLGIKDIMQ